MKALSMAIPCPGWPEKFPPPLKNFSRKSSRSIPIFYGSAAGMFSTAQEPYSPRVTCIGQVRARKSGGAAESRRRRSRFLKGKFLSKFRMILCKWGVFFKGGYCKKVDAEEDCFGVGRKIEFLSGKCESNNVEIIRVGDSCCSDPPRNALMLTRFSRASSLGERGENEAAESRIGGDSENPRNNNVGDFGGKHYCGADEV